MFSGAEAEGFQKLRQKGCRGSNGRFSGFEEESFSGGEAEGFQGLRQTVFQGLRQKVFRGCGEGFLHYQPMTKLEVDRYKGMTI